MYDVMRSILCASQLEYQDEMELIFINFLYIGFE